MTAYNCLYMIAIAVVMMMGWQTFSYAADDSSSNGIAPDGTPVVHKSLHKKKKSSTASTSANSDSLAKTPASSVAIVTPPPGSGTSLSATTKTAPTTNPASVPTVETGFPVARHSDTIVVASGYAIPPAPSGLQSGTPRGSTLASSLPLSPPPSRSLNGYSSTTRSTYTGGDFVFTNFPKKSKNNYPWKTGIYTTMFYIGEGSSSISSTDNRASSFDANWMDSNHGSDNPNARNGYAAAGHASTVNPFYIALPFNDLVYPDKARQWLPTGWHRPNQDGKPVSACKDRWVEIKTEDGSGHICYAQWEDVGPLRYDHAEYVFGPERPDTYTRAGLDVSPAVAQYLGLNEDKHPLTRWRFVDDEDVPPGAWLKYEEQAVLYDALHSLRSASPLSNPNLPIQRASEPIEDSSIMDTNKKKVGAAKG